MRTISKLFPDSPEGGPLVAAVQREFVTEVERRHRTRHRALSTVARMRLPAVLAALALLLLTACGSTTAASQEAGTASGASAGDARDLSFTSTTVAGETFQGSTLAGKPTVLWFWAPWCPTCRGQISGVSSLAEAHPDDLNVVGIGSLDDAAAIAEFAGKVSPEVTMLSDDDGAVWRHFGVKAQSTYLVLDKSGRQVASGYLSDDKVKQLVETMVG